MYKQLLFLLAFCSFISCDPCDNLDCLSSNYSGQFRIVSEANGSDLVFGPGSIYDKNQIKFYSINGADSTFFDYEPIRFAGNGYDSILYVNFYPEATTVYMKLNDTDTDTLTITYNSFNTKCCGNVTEITRFRFNNSIDLPGNEGSIEIRK